MKESTGRGPDLQDTDNPFTILSKRPKDGLSSASSSTRGISSHRQTSSVTIKRKAVAISRAQLHRGCTKHLESFTDVS